MGCKIILRQGEGNKTGGEECCGAEIAAPDGCAAPGFDIARIERMGEIVKAPLRDYLRSGLKPLAAFVRLQTRRSGRTRNFQTASECLEPSKNRERKCK